MISASQARRLEWLLLGAFALLILGRRLAVLDAYPVHEDEVRSFTAMKSLVATGLPLTDVGHIYWRALLAHWLMALPLFFTEANLHTARLVPVIFSALVLGVVFAMGRSVEDRRAGWLAALFLGFSAFEERYACFARFYLPFQFFFLCTVYFAGAYFIQRRSAAGPWLLASCLAAIGSHALAVEALPILGLAIVLGRRWELRKSWPFTASAVLVMAAFYMVLVYRPPNAYRDLLSARLILEPGALTDKWFYAKVFRDFTPVAATLLILGLTPIFSRESAADHRRLRIFYYVSFLVPLLALSLLAWDTTPRYVLNLYPLGILLASVSIAWWSKRLAELLRRRPALRPSLPNLATIAVITPALIFAVAVENWSPSSAFGRRIELVDQKPAHDVLKQRLRSGDIIISLAPSMTELYLGRPAHFGLREEYDREQRVWRPFTQQQKRYYAVPMIDRPDLLERIVTQSPNRLWLYANQKLLWTTSREMQGVIFEHFVPIYPDRPGASVLLVRP